MESSNPTAQSLSCIRRGGASGLMAAASIVVLAAATGASAADAPAPVGTPAADSQQVAQVVVTGSRIRGVGPVGSAVVGISQADIQQQGTPAVSDLLRNLPSVLNLGADPGHVVANQKGNANTSFGTGINLRGLGTPDTLVLIDGRRVAPSGISAIFTDPNVVPQSAVQRVEVQADGTSAIYGSDAVAGVVNIQLRKPFDGAETTARGGGGRGQTQYTVSQVLGKTWQGGGVFFDYEHRFQSRVKAADFSDWYTSNYTRHGGLNFDTTSASPGNIQVGSTLYALPANPNGAQIAASQLTGGTKNLQGYYAGGVDALPQLVRDSVLINARQDVASNVRLFGQGFYSNQNFDFMRSTGYDGVTSLSVPSSNPFYVTGLPGLTPGAKETVLYSMVNDLGPVHVTGYDQAASATLGATVSAPGGWQIEPAVTYSMDRTGRVNHTMVNNCALIGGVTLFGQPCAGTPALADPNPTTAFNPFAPGKTNPATLARIRAFSDDATDFRRTEAGLRADGRLFELPGGAARAAVGVTYTYDTMGHVQTRNDAFYATDNSQHNVYQAGLWRSNTAVYGELYVPIVGADNAVPLVKRLALSVAGRYERYSDVGPTSNPKVGVNWQVVDELSLHGSYGTSFRAPTLPDLAPNILGTAVVSVVPALNTLYPRLGPTGSNVPSVVVLGGNPKLKPETATTYSIGADYNPKWASGLKLSVNYYNIHLTNQIGVISPATALTDSHEAPFVTLGPSAAQVSALCASPYFTQGSCTNIGAIIDARSQNLGQIQTDGLDLSADYVFPSSVGTWDVGFTGAYILSFKQALLPGAPLIEDVNTMNYPLQFEGRGQIGWQKGPWQLTAFVNYQNAYKNLTITPNQSIGSNVTVDFTGNYDFGDKPAWRYAKNVLVSLHVVNVFDKKPPYVTYLGNATTPYFAFDPQNASALGRQAYIQITKRF